MQFLQRRDWPGNIRELENVVERLVTLAPAQHETITTEQLPKEFQKELKKSEHVENFDVSQSLSERLTQVEEAMIRQTLTANGWNQSQTARALKVPIQTLRYKMQKLGIPFSVQG